MMNSTPLTFDQVQTAYLTPPRNSSSGRSENELVAFLEKYYSLFLLIVGTVGNLLCLAVLSRETFRRSSAGIYLRFLTLSDLAAIYTGVLFFTARALFNINFRKFDELSCKFHRWLSFTACDLSSWALVLVSTARLLSIAWPMKRLITRRRVYASIFLTVVILFGANLPIFIIYGDVWDPIKNRTSLCVFTQESYEDFYNYVFSWLVLVKFGFLPGVLLIVLNAALVLTVSRSGRAVDQVISRKSHPERSSSPASRNLKTKMSVRTAKTETCYSSKSALDVERELSTGSDVSDGTLSSSDRNELSGTNKGNGHLVGVWSKIVLRLKFKNSHEPPAYRLKESGLRNLFCRIQMMWQGDELESQKDLVSLNEDVSIWNLTKQTSTEEKKQSSILSKETNFSWLDEPEKSDPENEFDLASAKISGQQYCISEDRTNMVKIPGVHKTNNGSDSNVDLPYWDSCPTDGSSSVGVGRDFFPDETISANQTYNTSMALCNNHANNENENIQLQLDVNVQHKCSNSCSQSCSLNSSCLDQRRTLPKCGDRLWEYNLAEKCSRPRDIMQNKNINPASFVCVSCRGFPVKNTESTINTGSDESIQPESIQTLTCTSQNDTIDIQPKDAVSHIEKLTESLAASQVYKLTEQSVVSQINNSTESPAVSQVEKLTAQPVVSQVGDFTESPVVSQNVDFTEAPVVSQVVDFTEAPVVSQVVDFTEAPVVSQVVDFKETPAIRRRPGYRHKSALQPKVCNKSRSLTRTLLVLNTVFLLCNTPITVYLTGKTYFWPDEYSDVQQIIVTLANFSMYTSNSINFILYCVTGSRFRGQLVLMFKDLYRFVGNCTRRLSRVYKQRS